MVLSMSVVLTMTSTGSMDQQLKTTEEITVGRKKLTGAEVLKMDCRELRREARRPVRSCWNC